jgi:hypothetical protein
MYPYVGPCHKGNAYPRVADGGDGLQIRNIAANILNKQSRTADRGRSSSLLRDVTQGLGNGEELLTIRVTISFSRTVLLHGVSGIWRKTVALCLIDYDPL